MMKINWKWPATPENGVRPGYWLAWALLWCPLLFLGKFLYCFSVGMIELSVGAGTLAWED